MEYGGSIRMLWASLTCPGSRRGLRAVTAREFLTTGFQTLGMKGFACFVGGFLAEGVSGYAV